MAEERRDRKTMSLYLTPIELEMLRILANEENRSMSNQVVQLIRAEAIRRNIRVEASSKQQ